MSTPRKGILTLLIEVEEFNQHGLLQPSVQKLVSQVHHDFLLHCNSEESLRNLPDVEENSRLNSVLEALRSHFSGDQSDRHLLATSMTVSANKVMQKDYAYKHLVRLIMLK